MKQETKTKLYSSSLKPPAPHILLLTHHLNLIQTQFPFFSHSSPIESSTVKNPIRKQDAFSLFFFFLTLDPPPLLRSQQRQLRLLLLQLPQPHLFRQLSHSKGHRRPHSRTQRPTANASTVIYNIPIKFFDPETNITD